MKINRLEHTKTLYPHFFDKSNDSNFTKHLEVVAKQQQDIRHKVKSIEWSRILEKPLQLWKTQSEPYKYDMHFKVQVPYLKEINVYKNPILNDDEEIVHFEAVSDSDDELGRVIHATFDYEDDIKFFEKAIEGIETNIYKYTQVETPEGIIDIPRRRIVPNDTYVLEVITWDDYRFIKGYPENDYTFKEDNILQYKYNETFLNIRLEEISYHKYLTFRVHEDRIKQILVRKNDKPVYRQSFINDEIEKFPSLEKSCYAYLDVSVINEDTYGQYEYTAHDDIEDGEPNFGDIYFADVEENKYVFRLPLSDSDFDEKGIIKDTYDLEVTTYEKRYRCLQEYDKVYTKRYCGYDNTLGDCFDHDYSLDIIGALLNVPRFRFYQIYRKNNYYLSRTYPAYYNRATESDYDYMKRIQYYISNYNHINFPVLEFWKYYHTDASIRSRKRIVGEMDVSYLRTNDSSCDAIYDGVDEEFEPESITEYDRNKATNINGSAKRIIKNLHIWYEAIIVDNLPVVPAADYRFRYGLKDNDEDVTIRLITYNREGVELRTTTVEINECTDSTEGYNVTEGYTYTDTYVTMPSDAVTIKIILESNDGFNFADASFERKTVVNFDTAYMVTDTDYNSNVYELYADYYKIPTNIRIGGSERFYILFKRSLPLTKSGFFYVDVMEDVQSTIGTKTETIITLDNCLSEDCFSHFDDNREVEVLHFLREGCNYTLSYKLKSNEIIEREDINPEDYFHCTIYFYNNKQRESLIDEIDSDGYYSDTTATVTHNFIIPEGTGYVYFKFEDPATVDKESVKLSRKEPATIEELTGGGE